MIDLPPEQVIEERLLECGLNPSGFTVKYEDYLQSIEITIKPEASATSDKFGCIHKAVDLEIVTFSDQKMDEDFRDFTMELSRPKILEDARQSLEKIGKLEGFPVRSAFANDKQYAEALEVHCGLGKGEAIKGKGNSLIFFPEDFGSTDYDAFYGKYSCLLTAASYATASGEWSGFYFVGNEGYSTEEDRK